MLPNISNQKCLIPSSHTLIQCHRDVPKASQNIISSTAQMMHFITLFVLFQFIQYYLHCEAHEEISKLAIIH